MLDRARVGVCQSFDEFCQFATRFSCIHTLEEPFHPLFLFVSRGRTPW